MAFDDNELNQRRQQHREEQKFLATQRKLLRIGFIITGITMVLCAATLLITHGLLRAPDPNKPSMESTTPPTEAPTEPAPPDTVIHFVAGGDINVTDKTVSAGNLPSGYDYGNVFLDILPVLAAGDLTAMNFEGNLFGAPYGTDSKSAPKELLQALKSAGVDFVQTANSYAVYNGLDGLQLTLQGIRQTGMEPLGTYADKAEFTENGGFVIRQVQGIRIAIVAFTKGMDGMTLPSGSENCVNVLYEDYDGQYRDINTAKIDSVMNAIDKQEPDLVVAMVHWGGVFNDSISASQQKICKQLQDRGADAIIGTHSHYVQQMQFDAATGQFVAYSLGDLMGSGTWMDARFSVVLDLEITKSGQTGETKITKYSYTPIYTVFDEETLRVVRIHESIAAYESGFVGRVSEATYNAMKQALTSLEKRITKEVP